MSIGKYSPTVSDAYYKDQDWWERNGGEDPANQDRGYEVYFFDRDGYDSYGYNVEGLDRAAVSEDQYLTTTEIHAGEVIHTLFEDVEREWTTDENGFPSKRNA